MKQVDIANAEDVEKHHKKLLDAINTSFDAENSTTRCVVLVLDLATKQLKTWSANASLYDAGFMLRTGCEIIEQRILEGSPDKNFTKELH
jgi:hypothetical protein